MKTSPERCQKAKTKASGLATELMHIHKKLSAAKDRFMAAAEELRLWEGTNPEFSDQAGKEARSTIRGLGAVIILDLITLHGVGSFFVVTFLGITDGFLVFILGAIASCVILFAELMVSRSYENARLEKLADGEKAWLTPQFATVLLMALVIPCFFGGYFYSVHHNGLLQTPAGWVIFGACLAMVLALHGTVLTSGAKIEQAKQSLDLRKEKRQIKKRIAQCDQTVQDVEALFWSKLTAFCQAYQNISVVCPEGEGGCVVRLSESVKQLIREEMPGFMEEGTASRLVLKEMPDDRSAKLPANDTGDDDGAAASDEEASAPQQKRRRGRPPGSKNKPKSDAA